MKRVRCAGAAQHFFDGDRYDKCPHCGAPLDEEGGEVRFERVEIGGATVPVSEQQTVALDWNDSGDKDVTISLDDLQNNRTDFLPTPPMRTDWSRDDDVKTVTMYSKGKQEPTVGWVVALCGNYYGKSFELISGQNFIGRDIGSAIRLDMETSISRTKHANIIFEPRKQVFFLVNGEGSGLTYHNDNLVMGNVELKPYDRIQIGEVVFLFVPLCGKNFQWSGEEI